MDDITRHYCDILFLKSPDTILAEVKHICRMLYPDCDLHDLETVYHDNLKLFQGEYGGFQACNTKYHDLDHTLAVFLASARLMHGVYLSGDFFSERNMVIGLIGALFHDAGFIQTEDDTRGTGAKYTVGHEQRSIRFISVYLPTRGFNKESVRDCGQIIACTILNTALEDIEFSSREVELMGKVVGTADLLAQMADRNYLEKLLYLYSEFEEAKMPGFDSELELLKKTEFFYKNQSKKRIEGTLGNIAPFVRLHFSERHTIDKDLYQDYIDKNIEYLKQILNNCEDNYRQMLRRKADNDNNHENNAY